MQNSQLKVLTPSNSQLDYSQPDYAQLIFIDQQSQMSFGVQSIGR
ncbi:hypothetical protein ACFIOZ_09570 [Vreelandella sp. F11]